MKIIDLLNKLANGEDVPKIFMYDKLVFQLDGNRYRDGEGDYLTDSIAYDFSNLNDEIQVIERLYYQQVHDNTIEPLVLQNFTSNQKKIARKVNEIIKILNRGE